MGGRWAKNPKKVLTLYTNGALPLERRYFSHMVVGPQIQVTQSKVWHPLYLTPLGLASSSWKSTNHFLDVHILIIKRSEYLINKRHAS